MGVTAGQLIFVRVGKSRKGLAGASIVGLIAFGFKSVAGALLPLPLTPLELITTLAWQASPSPEVAGYAVYYQVGNLPITNRVDVGKALSVTMPLLVGAIHTIYVVAYTADGVESEPSNLLNYTPPPITPVKLSPQSDGSMQLSFKTSPLSLCWLEWTPTLDPPEWRLLGLGWLVADAFGSVSLNDSDAIGSTSRFYRAVKF